MKQKFLPPLWKTANSSRSLTKPKYGNKKVGGYDSKKEYRRALELELKQRQGEISELRKQVRYLLVPAQRDENGKLIERAVYYVADFVYKDSHGRFIVEDTKGYRTRDYILKRKLMLEVHNIRITEI
jgi:hypothetical protein